MAKLETVLLEKADHIAKITLNRPHRLNAVNEQMFTELIAVLKEVADDGDVRVVVLTGAGRAFCASADMKDVGSGMAKRPPVNAWEFIRKNPQAVTLSIYNLEKPVIAMVNGLAVGDGFDWVLACDLRLGSENARFRNAFLGMGLVSNTGATWLYPRVLGMTKAAELMYTDNWLEADEAYKMGLLNRLVSAEKLESETMALAQAIASKPPIPNRLVKGMMRRGLADTLEHHLAECADIEVLTMNTADHREAIGAFLEKRKPKFKGE